MTSADRPSIFSLTPEARRAEYDAASDRACAAASETAKATLAARWADPRSRNDYIRFLTMGLVCVLVVKHGDKSASIECSHDGSRQPSVYLPTSKMIVLPESTREFVLALVPKWLAQRANLAGVTPDLVPAESSPDLEKQWDALRRVRGNINTKIYFARRRPSLFTRDQVA